MKDKEAQVAKEELILSNWYVGEVEGESLFISKVRDKIGEAVYLPRIVKGDGGVDRCGSKFGGLDKEQKERLEFCLWELNLSILPAIHLALNTKKDLNEELLNLVHRKTFVAFDGPPLAGKTAVLAAIVTLHKYTAISTDIFSKQTLNKYTDFLLSSRDGLSKEGFKDRLDWAIKESLLSNNKRQNLSVRQSLDLILHVSQSPSSQSVILVDVAGMDMDFRNMDVFDVMNFQSMDGVYKLPEFKTWEEMYDFAKNFPNENFVEFVKERQDRQKKAMELLSLRCLST